MRNIIKQILRENIEKEINYIPAESITLGYLINRIPFLKEYKVLSGDLGKIHLSKEQYNSNVEHTSPDLNVKVVFKHLNFFSTFYHITKERNNEIVHDFTIDNDIIAVISDIETYNPATQEKPAKDIIKSIIKMIIKKHVNDYSYSIEIKDFGQGINKVELDKVINEINKRLFQFGEYLSTSFKSDFLII